jgi:hypothetical protein
MAFQQTIGGNGTLFVGEDKPFELELLEAMYDADGVLQEPDENSVPVDMTDWDVLFDVRKTVTAPDPAIFSKHATIVGVYNISRALNTQRARVSLTDTEMNTVKALVYQHSWKRMDDGSETVLSYGPFTPEKATAP